MDTPETNQRTVDCVEWFFGYGGNHLGLKRVIRNLRLVAACEIESYAVANMVSKMEAGLLDPAPCWTNCKTFPVDMFRGLVDLFIASYPCQGFSAAGQRKGAQDPRFLWPWVLRAVAIIQPRYCFLENVAGHVTLGLSTVISDLEEAGYDCAWGIFSAEECGAPQQRKRVFILARRRLPDACGTAFDFRQEGFGQGEFIGAGEKSKLANPIGELRGASGTSGTQGRTAVASDATSAELANTSGVGAREPNNGENAIAASGEARQVSGGRSGVGLANASSEGREGGERAGAHEKGQAAPESASECRPLFWPGFVARPGEQQHEWEPPRVIKTQRGLGVLPDGSSGRVGKTNNKRGLNEQERLFIIEQKTRAREALLAMLSEIGAQEIQWPSGRLLSFLEEKILRSGVRIDFFPERIRIAFSSSQTSRQISRLGVPDVQVESESSHSPFGFQSCEQFQVELNDAVRVLSHEMALAAREDYSEERFNTDELRMLGNGVYPATASRAFITLYRKLNKL